MKNAEPTTDIEKKSLEAHVELCAERYRNLDNRLQDLSRKLEAVLDAMDEMDNKMLMIVQRRNDQVMRYAGGAIVVLLGAVGYLLATYVIN